MLAEAGAVLASSLDYAKTLRQIAKLVVDTIADICVVDILEEPDNNLMRLTVAHSDPSKAEACAKLSKLSLTPRNVLARAALETQKPQLLGEMTDDFLRESAASPEHLAILHELGPPRSGIVAPLITSRASSGRSCSRRSGLATSRSATSPS